MKNFQKQPEAPTATEAPALLCDMGGLRFRSLYSLFTNAVAPADREQRSVMVYQDGPAARIEMVSPDIQMHATAHPEYNLTRVTEYGEDKTAEYQQMLLDKLMKADPAYHGMGQLMNDYIPGTPEHQTFVAVMDHIIAARGVDAAWGTARDVLRAALAARMNEVRDHKVDLTDREVQALAGIMHFTSGVQGITLDRTDAPGVWQAFNSAIAEIASHIPSKQV